MRTLSLARTVLAAAVLIAQTGTAMADFRLDIGRSVEGMAAPPPAPEVEGDARPVPPPSRFRMAQGFGRSVSLKFAARQIVPPAVTVRFGAGVDPTSPVNWSGGQPWNHVLAAAVQPLGLRIMTGVNSVLILR